jgi:hypothetical protein
MMMKKRVMMVVIALMERESAVRTEIARCREEEEREKCGNAFILLPFLSYYPGFSLLSYFIFCFCVSPAMYL